MAYLNRKNIGKTWPIPRKGSKYLAFATHNQGQSIPLIVVMREILGLVRTKKELKKVIGEKQVFINGKEIREVNYPVGLFDVISLKDGKCYVASLSDKKKMIFEEIKGKDVKVLKIIGKKLLSKGKIQLNLMDGRNILNSEDVRVGDSVIYNFKSGKIDGIIKMEKGKIGFVVEGKHTSHKGKIEEIMERGGKSLVKIVDEEGKKINVWVKNVIVIG